MIINIIVISFFIYLTILELFSIFGFTLILYNMPLNFIQDLIKIVL